MLKNSSKLARTLLRSTTSRKYATTTKTVESAPGRTVTLHFSSELKIEDIVQDIRQNLATRTGYVSRYPDKTLEDFEAEFDELTSRPIHFDEHYINFMVEALGYTKTEAINLTSGKIPELVKPAPKPLFEGDIEINWEAVRQFLGTTTTRENILKEVEKSFKTLMSKIYDLENTPEPPNIDWEHIEKEIGPTETQNLKLDVEATEKLLEKPIDPDNIITKEMENAFRPLLEEAKDVFLDSLPDLKETVEILQKEAPLLEADENGVPLVEFNKDFLDKYYPEVRDEVIEEIETDEWDVEYIEERKQLRTTPDVLLQQSQKSNIKNQLEKIDSEYFDELTVTSSVTEEEKEFQRMYIDVVNLARKNLELENQVNTLKYSLMDHESEEKKDESEQTKEQREYAMKILRKYIKDTSLEEVSAKEGEKQ